MRISDWSSEVCASDLLTTYGSPDRLMLASSRFEVPVIVQRDSFGAEHLGAYYEVCRRDIASDPVDERKPHRSIIRIDGKSEMGHIRSEEHTSELQSLMRISYAVFCLKKKPNHTYSIIPLYHTK